MKDSVAVLIQARLGSERLQGKVTRRIGDAPMLGHVIVRAAGANLPVFVLTPAADREALGFARRFGARFPQEAYDGDEADVLGRFVHAICTEPQLMQVRWFVRITADCPFLDPVQVRMAAELAVASQDPYAYVSNVSYNRPVDGWDVEAFGRALLLEADAQSRDPVWREHVTPYMRTHAVARYDFGRRVDVRGADKFQGERNQYRWTVDTEDDLDWARDVHDELGNLWPPNPSAEAMLELMNTKPQFRRFTP